MESRLVPFTIAGVICFAAAFFLGAGIWYFLGSSRHITGNTSRITVLSEPQANENVNSAAVSVENNTNTPLNANAANSVNPVLPAPEKKAPAGEILISGGEVKVTDILNISKSVIKTIPVRRESVGDFYIGETEVSNAQYAEFIEAASRKAPQGWKNGKFPAGAANEPVTGVTWTDANAYCEWLSKNIGATVRLPTGEEWLRAARGETDNKYPWGDEWSEEAVRLGGKKTVNAVKTNEKGRSPFGVYEMLGNVWEWTSDLAVDEAGKPVLSGKNRQRIIRGCSYGDFERSYITLNTTAPRPENEPSKFIGFRYVVIRK